MNQNTKHKTPKTNSGITLIALVITIIVMLILVAVTISMAVNGGLFDYARKAGQETNAAVEAEQQLANLEANLTVNELIEKFSGVNASLVKSNPEKYYGKVVTGYTLPEANTEEITWKIFHSDGENIYLIASDYVATVPDGAKGNKIYVNTPMGLSMNNVVNDYALNENGKYLIQATNPAKNG